MIISSIQPQQEFMIPQNQCVSNSNNTFQPPRNGSLMIRELCVGRIVFLPRNARGIQRVKCILPHSLCKRPELDPMEYDHYFVILDVFQKHNGEVKCYVCPVRFLINKLFIINLTNNLIVNFQESCSETQTFR